MRQISKIMDEIIDSLSSDRPNTTTALLKTKILLHKLGEKKLLPWVNNELSGYPDEQDTPQYRVLHIGIKGSIRNQTTRYPSQVLTVSHLDEIHQKNLTTVHATQSIAVIEEYSNSDGTIEITIEPAYYSMLSKCLSKGYVLESAVGIYNAGAMTQIVTEVRSRLLDFILELSDRIPENLEDSEIKIKSKEFGVTELFKNTFFGNNTTIVVGDGNRQHTENTVVKNDLNSLLQMLQKEGLAEIDVSELATAIDVDKDSVEIENGTFGKNVTNWIGEMVKKSGTSAWNISIGTASNLLATAIGKFYGF